jgi:hypothetical protein
MLSLSLVMTMFWPANTNGDVTRGCRAKSEERPGRFVDIKLPSEAFF